MKKSAKQREPSPEPEDQGFESYDDEESKGDGADHVVGDGQPKFILYDIIGLPKTATQDEVKKAYRKLVLLKHPDKCPGDEKAADNFQQLQKAYSILSDPKKRERYDRFGDDEDNEDFGSQTWMDAYQYYRAVHPELSKQDIRSFADRYKNSSEEQKDLLDYYQSHDGDLRHILQSIICSANEDVPRFLAFYDEQLAAGHLKRSKRYDATKAQIELLPDERVEAKQEKKRLKAEKEKKQGGGSMADLEKMILAKRGNAFGGFLNYMTEKYGGDEEEPQVGKKKRANKGNGKDEDTPQKRKKTK